jgi:hypothetical protein
MARKPGAPTLKKKGSLPPGLKMKAGGDVPGQAYKAGKAAGVQPPGAGRSSRNKKK